MSGPQPHYGQPQYPQPPQPREGIVVSNRYFAVGPADLTVAVQPNQLVELKYGAPLWTLSRGSLGPPPQKYNGQALLIALTVIGIVLALAVMISTLP